MTEQEADTKPATYGNGKQELGSVICQLIFTRGIFEIVHLTFRTNDGEKRQRRLRAAVMSAAVRGFWAETVDYVASVDAVTPTRT